MKRPEGETLASASSPKGHARQSQDWRQHFGGKAVGKSGRRARRRQGVKDGAGTAAAISTGRVKALADAAREGGLNSSGRLQSGCRASAGEIFLSPGGEEGRSET
jgi:ribosomal protein L18